MPDNAKLDAIWAPQEGQQLAAIEADWCDEILYGGAKYGGKSDFLLGDFLQGVEQWEKNWHGILIRQSLPELEDVIRRSHELYPKTGAEWGEQKKTWFWKNGATLKMRPLERYSDFTKYNGHSYTWIGFDELGQWPDPRGYKLMRTCCRWGMHKVTNKRIRSTANPGQAGHAWIKDYFIDYAPLGFEPKEDPMSKKVRMFIPARVSDNKIGLAMDPNYIGNLRGVGSPALVKAWLEGDWNAIVGAYFTEFSTDSHVIEPFTIPSHWSRFTSFDWGSSAPFCYGWYAISDGSPINDEGRGYPKGAVIKYREFYGAKEPGVGLKLDAEQVAEAIKKMQPKDERILYSVADPAIFIQDGGPSIAERMRRRGIFFRKADNKRLSGWDQMRARLVGMDDKPMLYFFKTCVDTIRTIPALQHDPRIPEDVDTRGDDHAGDETRYALMSRPWLKPAPKKKGPIRGVRSMTLNELWDCEKPRHNEERI